MPNWDQPKWDQPDWAKSEADTPEWVKQARKEMDARRAASMKDFPAPDYDRDSKFEPPAFPAFGEAPNFEAPDMPDFPTADTKSYEEQRAEMDKLMEQRRAEMDQRREERRAASEKRRQEFMKRMDRNNKDNTQAAPAQAPAPATTTEDQKS